MEVKGLVIQSLWMGDASHLTGGAISLQVFISFTLAFTFLTDSTNYVSLFSLLFNSSCQLKILRINYLLLSYWKKSNKVKTKQSLCNSIYLFFYCLCSFTLIRRKNDFLAHFINLFVLILLSNSESPFEKIIKGDWSNAKAAKQKVFGTFRELVLKMSAIK